MWTDLITRPQRSWAKVIFSQACVKNSIHRGGGGCLPQCMLGYTPPPRSRHPPGPGRHPGGRVFCLSACWDTPAPPQSRYPPDQADTLGGGCLPQCMLGYTPPGADTAPRPGRHPPRANSPPPGSRLNQAYGLRAAGTHPTGMHSCFL